MRMISLLRKSIKENIRDWKILNITLVMAPIYVLITYSTFGNTNQSYNIIISNHDNAVIMQDGTMFYAGKDIIDEMKKMEYSDKTKVFNLNFENNLQIGEKLLKDRTAEIYIIIPENFSKTLRESINDAKRAKAKLIMYGDEANPKYMMARVLVDTSIYGYITMVTGSEFPMEIEGKSIENSKAPTPFGAYIPGLLALSLISLMFTAVASIIKEIDKGTIKRIKISKIRPMEFLTSISITQAIISIPVLLFTYITAFALGYRPAGSVTSVLVVGFLSSFSIMAISLLIASFISTIFELMTVGSLPYFLILFFSGAWFPMPGKNLFYIGSHPIGAMDILPISHTVSAMNKILNFGSGLRDVVFELCVIVALTVIYFSIGVWLFNKRHMKAV